MHLSTCFFDMLSLSPDSLYLQSLCTIFLFWHVAHSQPEALRSLMPAQRCLRMYHVVVPGSAKEHKSFEHINISLWFLFSLSIKSPQSNRKTDTEWGKWGSEKESESGFRNQGPFMHFWVQTSISFTGREEGSAEQRFPCYVLRPISFGKLSYFLIHLQLTAKANTFCEKTLLFKIY